MKQKVKTSIGIAGFAVGFSVFITTLLFVNREYNIDTCYDNYKNIYRITENSSGKRNADLDYDLYDILKEHYSGIEMVCPVRQKGKWPFMFRTNKTFIKTSSFVSTTNDFFKMFSIKTVKRSGKEPFANENSVVLTQSTAAKLFPNQEPLGESIVFMGGIQLTVTAIIEDLPDGSSFSADLLLNAENSGLRFGKIRKNGKGINPINHFIQLGNDVDYKQVEQAINKTLAKYSIHDDPIVLQPIQDIYLSDKIIGDYNKKGNRQLIILLEGIAILILLVAFINYIHFILSMQLSTKKAVVIKRIHGISIRSLYSYFLSESLLLIGASLLLAFVFAIFQLPLINSIFKIDLNIKQVFNPTLIAIWGGVILFIILLLSFFSVKSATRKTKNGNLVSEYSKGSISYKSILTTFQLAVSIILIACAIVVNMQLKFMKDHSLGFDSEQLVRIDLPSTFNSFQVLKDKVNQLAFVKNSSWSNGAPGYINNTSRLQIGEKTILLNGIYGDKDFLNTMNIKRIEGSDFWDSGKDTLCMVNESFMKESGCKTLDDLWQLNKKIEGRFKIVGVVEDFSITSFHSLIEPCYIAFAEENHCFLNVRLSQGNIPEMIRQLKKVWNEIIPNQPFEVVFYDDHFDSLYKKEERYGTAVLYLSLITILITCLGILGQIIHCSIIRTKEIGIRKVNGAKISEILTLLNKDFIKWVAIAFVIATPIAYYSMNLWLQNFAYKTELSWWIFALAGILALGIALLTVSWQSWRAATRNPVEALRYE
ncbi:ABC transporter permease [Carboxylicivirga linearis]|uniref:ABC transporter permease n=1 Tax=Carboxylicivirga linearis TaxID=1628157 RepID=A0ABS5JQZ5_9BACT|nr:ABC transporter permease [Carboxylicivirga linearis]MBS2097245.1 ABC transporter permease [Carboxylicivirga linearis]